MGELTGIDCRSWLLLGPNANCKMPTAPLWDGLFDLDRTVYNVSFDRPQLSKRGQMIQKHRGIGEQNQMGCEK